MEMVGGNPVFVGLGAGGYGWAVCVDRFCGGRLLGRGATCAWSALLFGEEGRTNPDGVERVENAGDKGSEEEIEEDPIEC